MSSAAHAMAFGAECQPGSAGLTRFALWAPGCARVELELHEGEPGRIGRHLAMTRQDDGWHRCTALAPAGTLYSYRVREDLSVPDPASRFNPHDVHGPSEVVEPRAFAWTDTAWAGRPWSEAVIYELHVGTYTPEGTFAAAARELGALRRLGITAIELMPVADFPGRRNWGYDGVLPFAPEASYGRPDDLKRLVDAAHHEGLMVILDVVYNHFGPDGNYLSAYCPEFFDPSRQTPWGAAIAFAGAHGETVREFFVENALYWVQEFRFDGLRLDAVHAIRDGDALVRQIAQRLQAGPGRQRAVHLILENDDNAARLLARDPAGRPLAATAQWNDDWHHAAHAVLTGEADGYYSDYGGDPTSAWGRAGAEGFVYQGQPSAWRDGSPRGEPSAALPPTAFVAFLQNHDQVGNRALGERIETLADPQALDAALTCLLLSPQVPMLFMGDEFAATTPFLYFCDASGPLADAIRDGRRNEFAAFAAFADPAGRARLPDPNALSTFAASRLDPADRARPRGRQRWQRVQELLALRRAWLQPLLDGVAHGGQSVGMPSGPLSVVWPLRGARWRIDANFGAAAATVSPGAGVQVIHTLNAAAGGPDWRLQRFGVLVSLAPLT